MFFYFFTLHCCIFQTSANVFEDLLGDRNKATQQIYQISIFNSVVPKCQKNDLKTTSFFDIFQNTHISLIRNLYWESQMAEKLSVLKPWRLRNL